MEKEPISFEEAQNRLKQQEVKRRSQQRDPRTARFHVLSEEVEVREDSPRFDNSAMDGYAVRKEDLRDAGKDHPVRLQVVDEVPAGTHPEEMTVESGEAIRIFTGAPVPEGTTAVVMQEKVEREGDEAIFSKPVRKSNIRPRGKELKEGEPLLPEGTVVSPSVIGVLLSQGITSVPVYRKPDVAVISTGAELVPPEETPGPGQIRSTNGHVLEGALKREQISPSLHTAGDDETEIRETLEDMLQSNEVVLLSGGVSVGEHDLVRDAAEDLGVEQIFWGVWKKPGKPVFAGRRDDTFVLGFPGNPVSNLVCFYLYGLPLVRDLSGFPQDERTLQKGVTRLHSPVEKRIKRPEFARAETRLDGDELRSRLMDKQRSHMLSGMAEANSLVRLPEGDGVSTDQTLQVLFLPDG